jgi:hypothetical protein
MPIAYSHVLRRNRRPRRYKFESASYWLIHWLNNVGDRKARSRVASVLEDIKQLSRLGALERLPVASLNPRRPELIGDKSQLSNLAERSQLSRSLNRMLSRYWMHPLFERRGAKAYVSWTSPTDKKLKIPVLAGGDFGEFTFGEADAVSGVLHLAQQGVENRVMTCKCGKWFYAKFSHQRFCGTPCQMRTFRKTDEFRANRRKYMQSYRSTLAKLAKRTFKARPRKAEK